MNGAAATVRRSGVHPITRLGVWAFLSVFAVCGVFGFELWPFTGWRLFADAREQRHISWSSEAEFADGSRAPFVVHAPGSNDVAFLIGRLAGMPPNDRHRLCNEWIRLGARPDQALVRIRVYRQSSDLAVREGRRAAPPVSSLAYSCTSNGFAEATA